MILKNEFLHKTESWGSYTPGNVHGLASSFKREKSYYLVDPRRFLRISKGGKHKYSQLPDISSMYADALHPEGSIRREFWSSDWFLICIICT